MRAYGSFTVASALMSPEGLEQALLYPKQRVELDMTTLQHHVSSCSYVYFLDERV